MSINYPWGHFASSHIGVYPNINFYWGLVYSWDLYNDNFHDQVWPRIFLLESGSNFGCWQRALNDVVGSVYWSNQQTTHTHIIHECSSYDVWETQFHGIQTILSWWVRATNKKRPMPGSKRSPQSSSVHWNHTLALTPVAESEQTFAGRTP